VTTEQRVYITLNEFLEIEIGCKHEGCEAKISWPVEKNRLVDRCPSCKGEWFAIPKDARRDHLTDLLEGIRNLRNNFDGAKFDLRIRINPNAA
jgi:hypothetical protein